MKRGIGWLWIIGFFGSLVAAECASATAFAGWSGE